MERQPAESLRIMPQVSRKPSNNEVPRELMLNLLAQGYPLEELLEFFPMFTLDQLMLLMDDEVIH